MLSENDLHRYSRQVIIKEFDEEGQQRLLKTKCLIVGAGGLGCPVALYAAAAGFGHIEIYDQDIIEISNLNRQIAYQNNDIGRNKAETLEEKCININPNIYVKSHKKNFNKSININSFDIVFDCSDNAETRYTLNHLCHSHKKILISGSAIQMEGQFSVWKSGIDIKLPCYECAFPKTKETAPVTNCREAGIIGPITSFISSMQVNEAIKEVALKKYFSAAGYLFLYDGLNQNLEKIKLIKQNDCLICSK